MNQSTAAPVRTGKSLGGRFRSLARKLGLASNGASGLRQTLEDLFEENREVLGELALSAEEIRMLFNILKNGDLRIHQIMVPRVDLVAADVDAPFDDMVKMFSEAAHSRLPLFRGGLDEVVGMVHVKDALKVLAERSAERTNCKVAEIQRPVLFVAPSMRAMDLLTKMRASRIHMAIVVDEYGGTDGLVTIEDLVEQIVGDIEDEHDVEEPVMIRKLGEGKFDIDARLPIAELEGALATTLEEEGIEDIDTVGGLVFSLVGRVPQIGERIKYRDGIRFEVVDAEPRRIRRLRVFAPKRGAPQND